MAFDRRDAYAKAALDQLPRLISNMDRNQYSPTYGCFHRDYWLDKTSDFPDAVRQFGVQSLALVYKRDFSGNIYKKKKKICDWAIAGLDFWSKIQHKDGSFDEFYPFERGWVGPTAFTTFTSIEAFNLLKDEMPEDVKKRVLSAIRKAAYFIAKGESEEDHLANHHAMACLAVWKSYELLQEEELKESYNKLFQGFLLYHNSQEGWSREYDGVDPGYLSATVSFFGKIYQTNPDPKILEIVSQSIEFCSYFVYPNGFYAGSLGSRNTLHFYAHGFEVFANEIPLAGAIAEKMLIALSEDKLVPPSIISDRYVFYRVPELLQAYLDYYPRQENLPAVPYEEASFNKFFSDSRIWVLKKEAFYCISNFAKGGVLKIFDCKNGELILNDCGIIGQLENGKMVTSQWIDMAYDVQTDVNDIQVSGQLNIVPSNKLFNPLKNIVFRIILLLIGWNPKFAHLLKGRIRKILMLGNRRVQVQFKRKITIGKNTIALRTEIITDGKINFKKVSFGDEFFVRYVPQSRYFQSQELDISGEDLKLSEIEKLNKGHRIIKEKVVNL